MCKRASKVILTQCGEHVLPLSQQVNHEGVDPYFIDGKDTTDSNWMKFVNTARHKEEQNVTVYKYHGNIYFRTFKTISPESELLGGYGKQYEKILGEHTNTEGE